MANDLLKAYFALAVVCIVWGTTYFAMRIGVNTIPPFLFSGFRQVVAGGILLLFLKITGKLNALTRTNFIRQAIPGILMITLGNGVVGWSEKFIPSGLAALIVSIMPVYIVIVSFVSGVDRKMPNIAIVAGLIMGTLGIILIFNDNLSDLSNPSYFTGMLVAFGAALAWASGSVYTKYKPSKADPLVNAAMQMLIGGIVLLLMSLFLDDFKLIQPVSSDSFWALVYLIVIGSLLSYPCFIYALDKLPVGLASIYAYINPLIALMLGFFLLNEKLTTMSLLALFTTLTGVYFINRGYRQKNHTLRLTSSRREP